jgi:hypothetical protein
MVESKKKQADRRAPGPKRKPAIPESFRISRQINPMSLILNEAENRPLQNLNPVQVEAGSNLAPGSKIEPPAKSEPPVKIEPPINSEPATNPAPGSKIEPGSKTESGKGFLQIPNDVIDNLFLEMDHTSIVVYLRLYRLSFGFGKSTCNVSIGTLAKRCKCSENTIRAALKKLINIGIVRIVNVKNTGDTQGGTIFEVYTQIGQAFRNQPPTKFEPGSENDPGANFEPSSKTEPSSRIEPIKDHDHEDLKKHDHHQNAHERETMMIYQTITGNNWKKTDQTAYEKIKNIPVETIEQGIRVTIARAATRPGSLAYFVKEILAIANPAPTQRGVTVVC